MTTLFLLLTFLMIILILWIRSEVNFKIQNLDNKLEMYFQLILENLVDHEKMKDVQKKLIEARKTTTRFRRKIK